MHWSLAILPLAGTVAGGGITVVGQHLLERRKESAAVTADSRKETAAVTAAERVAFINAVERSRTHVTDLNERVWNDLAEIRAAVIPTDELDRQSRARALDPVAADVRTRHDRAGSLIVLVADQHVRDAADAVYEAWGRWIAQEVESMVNGTSNSVDASVAMDSGTKFAAAVRQCLVELGEDEANYFR